MSSQRGNTSRSRPQKHKNKTAFKNDLHDKSHTIKQINSLEISNVCAHCKGVIEWKVKYKKYKPLKAPASCVKCHNKTVKYSYHTICTPCAQKDKICPKCGKAETLVPATNTAAEEFLKTAEVKNIIKSLPERRKRTFNRFVEKTLSQGANVLKENESLEDIILGMLKEMALNSGKSDISFDEFEDGEDEESDTFLEDDEDFD